jgi:hypothetical protein
MDVLRENAAHPLRGVVMWKLESILLFGLAAPSSRALSSLPTMNSVGLSGQWR